MQLRERVMRLDLRAIRVLAGRSIDAVAREAHVAPPTLRMYENNPSAVGQVCGARLALVYESMVRTVEEKYAV